MIAAGIPTEPLVDPQTGMVTVSWLLFFTALRDRTGGAVGMDVALEIEALRRQIRELSAEP